MGGIEISRVTGAVTVVSGRSSSQDNDIHGQFTWPVPFLSNPSIHHPLHFCCLPRYGSPDDDVHHYKPVEPPPRRARHPGRWCSVPAASSQLAMPVIVPPRFEIPARAPGLRGPRIGIAPSTVQGISVRWSGGGWWPYSFCRRFTAAGAQCCPFASC